MAIQLQKSGNLLFIRGRPDPPERQGRTWNMGLWLLIGLLLLGAIYAPELPSKWSAVSHTFQTLFSAVW